MKSLLHMGSGKAVVSGRIVCIVSPNSAPIRRMKKDARSNGKLIDATEGKQARAVIVTDSGHIILCSMGPMTLLTRLQE